MGVESAASHSPPVIDVRPRGRWGKEDQLRTSLPAELPIENVRIIPMGGAVADPPKFVPDAYEGYRRKVRLRGGVTHWYFDDCQLVAKLAMLAQCPMRLVAFRYIKEGKGERRRNVEAVIQLIYAEFDRPNQEIAIKNKRPIYVVRNRLRRLIIGACRGGRMMGVPT